jgi:tyrosine-protein phosphatase non-receptor type 14/21
MLNLFDVDFGDIMIIDTNQVTTATCLFFQNVDIPTVLATLRGQRMHMVQTVSQYTFVYKSLIQYLKNSRLI